MRSDCSLDKSYLFRLTFCVALHHLFGAMHYSDAGRFNLTDSPGLGLIGSWSGG